MRRFLLLRIVRAIVAVTFLSLLFINFFARSFEVRMISLVFLVVLLALTVLQLYYLLRLRRQSERWRRLFARYEKPLMGLNHNPRNPEQSIPPPS